MEDLEKKFSDKDYLKSIDLESPPKKAIINIATKILKILLEKKPDSVDTYLGYNGEVLLTAYNGNCSYEFIIEPDETICYFYYKNDKLKKEIEDVSFSEIKKLFI